MLIKDNMRCLLSHCIYKQMNTTAKPGAVGWAIYKLWADGKITHVGHGYRRVQGSDSGWYFPPNQPGLTLLMSELEEELGVYEKYLGDLKLYNLDKGGRTRPILRPGHLFLDPVVLTQDVEVDRLWKARQNECSESAANCVKKVYIKTANQTKTKLDGITDSRGVVIRNVQNATPIVRKYIDLIEGHRHAIATGLQGPRVPYEDDEDDAAEEDDLNVVAWVDLKSTDRLSNYNSLLYVSAFETGTDKRDMSLFKTILHDVLEARAGVITRRRLTGMRIDDDQTMAELNDITIDVIERLRVKHADVLQATPTDATRLLRAILDTTMLESGISVGTAQTLRTAVLMGQRIRRDVVALARVEVVDQVSQIDLDLRRLRSVNPQSRFVDRIATLATLSKISGSTSYFVVYLSVYTPPVIFVNLALDIPALGPTFRRVIKTTATLVDFIPSKLSFPLARYVLSDGAALHGAPQIISGKHLVAASYRSAKTPLNTTVAKYWISNTLKDGIFVLDRPLALEDTVTQINESRSLWFTVVLQRRTIRCMLVAVQGNVDAVQEFSLLADSQTINEQMTKAISGIKTGQGYLIAVEALPGIAAFCHVNHGKAYDKRVRDLVLKRVNEGISTKAKIAKDLGISTQTITRYVDSARSNIFDHRQGRNQTASIEASTKLSISQQFVLFGVTKKLGTVTAEEFIDLYNRASQIVGGMDQLNATVSTVNRWRKRLGLSYKRAGLEPTNLYVRSVAAVTHLFETERLPYLQHMRKKLVFIDEASLYLNEAPTMTWGERGQDHTVPKNKNQGMATRFIVAVGFPTWDAHTKTFIPFVRYWVLPPRPEHDPAYNLRPILTKAYQDRLARLKAVNGCAESDKTITDMHRLLKKKIPLASKTLVVQTMDGVVFRQFLDLVLAEDSRSNGCILCMDNAPIHNTHDEVEKNLTDLFKTHDWMVQWLPIYNPHYNVAELALSFIKHYVRKGYPTSYQELVYMTDQACKSIRSEHIFGWFRKCGFVPTPLNVGKRVDADGERAPVGSSFVVTRVLTNKEEAPIKWPTNEGKIWPKPVLEGIIKRLRDLTRDVYVDYGLSVWALKRSPDPCWFTNIDPKTQSAAQLYSDILKNHPLENVLWERVTTWKKFSDVQVGLRASTPRVFTTPVMNINTSAVIEGIDLPWPSIDWDTSLYAVQRRLMALYNATTPVWKSFLVSYKTQIWLSTECAGENPLTDAVTGFGILEDTSPQTQWDKFRDLLVGFSPGMPTLLIWTKSNVVRMVDEIVATVIRNKKHVSKEAMQFHNNIYSNPEAIPVRPTVDVFAPQAVLFNTPFPDDVVIDPPTRVSSRIRKRNADQMLAEGLPSWATNLLSVFDRIVSAVDNNLSRSRKSKLVDAKTRRVVDLVTKLRTQANLPHNTEYDVEYSLRKTSTDAILVIWNSIPKEVHDKLDEPRLRHND